MEEEKNFVYQTIKRKIYSPGLLIPVGICLALAITVLFFAEPATPSDESARFFITGFFMIFVIVFGHAFYVANRNMRTALHIKENGTRYDGRVINAQKRYVRTSKNTRVYTDLLVEFKESFDTNYIVSYSFPYDLKLKGDFGLFDPVTKADYVDEESRVRHTQYRSNGYITFDNHDGMGKPYIYDGSKLKNYLLDNDLTCSVFELDGKYVVDDFIGLDRSKVMSKKLIEIIIPLLFIGVAISICFLNR